MSKLGVFFRILFVFSLLCALFTQSVSALSATSAAGAILIDAHSGSVLYAKDADTRRGMASTTKIMTAIVAIEQGDLERSIEIPDAAIGVEGSSLYLKHGETLTLRELLYGLLLQSANDAATAIAIAVGGDVETFVDLMNVKADELGLTDTHFANPHGLANEEHYTTPRELAEIAAYALQNATFREICSCRKSKIGDRVLVNHNKMLLLYDGACGVKTGFTKATGRCLVSAAERDGVLLVAVTLNAPDDWNDHTLMLDYGFSALTRETLIDKGEIVYSLPVMGGDTPAVDLVASDTLSATLPKTHGAIVIKAEIPRYRFAPVYQGDILGKIRFFCDGKELGEVLLTAKSYIGKSN